MELNEKPTLGDFFQNVRKEKGVSVDEIVRETNISKRYLIAIEENNFEIFPGETYIKGFIGSYADALEVPREDAYKIYHRQIQIEQNAPIEELVGLPGKASKKSKPSAAKASGDSKPAAMIFVALLVIVVIVIAVFRGGDGNTADDSDFTFDENTIDDVALNRFSVGDTIKVETEDHEISLTFSSIGASQNLKIKVNRQVLYVKQGEILNIDTDDNEIDDFGIEVLSVASDDIQVVLALHNEEDRVLQIVSTLSDDLSDSINSETEILTTEEIEPVTLTLTGSASGYIAYSADGGDEVEMLSYNGLSSDIYFEDSLVLLLANAGAVELDVNGETEDGGSMGEASKSVFYWKSASGKYTLVRALLD